MRKEKVRKSFLQHQKVQKGQEHYSRTGKLIPAVQFQSQTFCKCKLKCHTKIDENQQYQNFHTFYDLPNWTTKTMFLRSCIIRNEVNHRLSNMNPIMLQKNRNYTYRYELLDFNTNKQEVCSNFFYKCLQVSKNRVYRAIRTTESNPSANDKRGNQSSINKTNDMDIYYVKEFIDQFPKYKSHYGRNDSDKDYLPPHLNIRKMYKEYKNLSEFEERTVLSEGIFREIFNTKFNLAFKRPKTDTCKRCDEINVKIKSGGLSYEQLQSEEKQKLYHHENVREKKKKFEKDVEEAKKSNGKTECYTFDLQRTLETPSLSTSVAYYKRQLWTYNLCIYDEVNEKGYMYMWSEDVASRGANEVGSCLIKHVNTYAPINAEKLILYSDTCGGQNRNIKITLLLKKLLASLANLKEITQKFFISGHSYNSCDRCFGIIDKQKKMTQDIFVPAHWENIVRQSKKKDPKFEVVHMASQDFYSAEKLLNLIVNRKVTSENEKINWFDIESIRNDKGSPFSLYVKKFQSSNEFQINLHKKDVLQHMFNDAELENTPEVYISKEKFEDLISLIKYIPSKYHDFYKNLKYKDGNLGDYSLADYDNED